MSIVPRLDTWEITMLATISPLVKSMFDAEGSGVPAGYTVRKLGSVPPIAVTLATIAVTCVGSVGIPAKPVTLSVRDTFAPIAPPVDRVSRIRVGVRDT